MKNACDAINLDLIICVSRPWVYVVLLLHIFMNMELYYPIWVWKRQMLLLPVLSARQLLLPPVKTDRGVLLQPHLVPIKNPNTCSPNIPFYPNYKNKNTTLTIWSSFLFFFYFSSIFFLVKIKTLLTITSSFLFFSITFLVKN